MINVLELIDGGFLGGGQTHILSVMKNLNREIFNPFISASPSGEFAKETKRLKFNFSPIELPKFYNSNQLKNIYKTCTDNKIDIIHSHGGVAGMYARLYKRIHREIKVVHTIHGIHYINSNNLIKKHVSHLTEKYLVKYTDRFICVSEADFKTAEKLKIINHASTVIIKNGIDTERFSNKGKDNVLASKLGLNENNIVIGNISRFDFQKNQRLIIKNAKSIIGKHPEVKILLAGNGIYYDECRKIAEDTGYGDSFIFTGEINDPEKYYPLFDVFIFPTLWEGLSISLIESMASANCILASNIPANKELIENETDGLLFDPENENEYLLKLERLIEDASFRKRLSEKALGNSKNYSDKVMTEKIEKVYNELI